MTTLQYSPPQVGQPLPSFSLPSVIATANGAELSTRSNADFIGNPLVLFVYPKDATSGCTIEVCGFRDLYDEFRVLDVEVVGLSRDGTGAHKKFIESQKLPFALLADREQALLESCNLVFASTMYGKPVTKVRRTTFLVDASGIVRRIWDDVSPLGHAREVLESARQLV
ncbi:MAG TPA: peroxiredoxin [Abditibacteriaceae bacterium]|jgi:peroxiredoxin Q/BCP|nr:peroxiredoxin [Abditibacteriaceae bacterium]